MALLGNTADAKIRIGFDGKQAVDGLNKIKSSLSNATQGVKAFAARFGPAAIATAALTKSLQALGNAINFVKESTEAFEKTMSRIKSIVDPTASEFGKLEEKAKKFGETTVFTASQVGEAFVEMGKLGFKTNQIIAASEGVLNLAAAAQVDMATAAMATVSTLNQFGMSANKSNRVVDVMAKSFTSSALDMTKFTEAMKYAGPVAANTGIQMEEVAAAMAVLADNGIDASMAGTALRKIMLEFSNANSKASKIIKEINPEATTLSEKFKALAEGGLSATKATDLFSIRATTAAQILAQTTEKMDSLNESFLDAEGSAKRMADTMLDNVAGATVLLKSAQEGLAIAIGESFSESKKDRIDIYAEHIRLATGWVKEHQGELKLLGQIITATVDGTIRFARAVSNTIQTIFGVLNTGILGSLEFITRRLANTLELIEFALVKVNQKFDKLVPDGMVEAITDAKDAMYNFANITKIAVSDSADATNKDLMEIWQSLANIKTKAEETTEVMQNIPSSIPPVVSEEMEGGTTTTAPSTEAAQKIQERYDSHVDIYRDHLNTMSQLRHEFELSQLDEDDYRYQVEKERLENFKELGVITYQEYYNAISELAEEYAEEQEKRDSAELQRKIFISASAAQFALSSLSTIAQASKANAIVQKRISQTQAIVNTAVAASKANTATPWPPVNAVLMALAIAQGLAQVAIIERQKFAFGGLVGEVSRSRQPDNVNASLGRGEYVMPAPQTSQNLELLESIRNNTANTARGLRGNGITNNYYGLSTEQVLNIQREQKRRNYSMRGI